MQGRGLMQALARVNRVFRDKPGGLVVDYLGLADQLKRALATYTESGGTGAPTYDTRQAIAVMLEKHDVISDMLHPLTWAAWSRGPNTARLALIPAGQQRVLEQENGKPRFVQLVTELSQAFALGAASDDATAIRDDVSYFQAVQSALNKHFPTTRRTPEQIDAALRVIATELVTQVRKSVTIDWTVRDSARARIRVLVKRILNRYGYPPDLQDAASRPSWRRRSC